MSSWTMFANRNKSNLTHPFAHIHPIPHAVAMCGDAPIIPVTVSLDPEGPYWGWMDARETQPCMIQYAEILLDMCFPYGMDNAVKQGQGQPVRLRVEEVVGEVEHPAWVDWVSRKKK